MEDIVITKDKEHFLKSERSYFTNMTDTEYKYQMYDDMISCNKCGVLYWKDCAKRCDCR